MHNKLTSQVVLALRRCRISSTHYTYPKNEIRLRPWKCQTFHIRDFVTFCRDRVKMSRNFVAYNSTQIQRKEIDTLKVNTGENFCLNDYDCVGFDLDNTITTYKVNNMLKLEYELLSQFLVEKKGYDPSYLYKPVEDCWDFMKKGLILDVVRGNVLQINWYGQVLKASHGTKFLSEKEIVQTYGEDRCWKIAAEFSKNPIEAWNGPLSEKIRSLLDNFDMPSSLVFARIVDSLDAKGNSGVYNIWPDILDGLIFMFNREHFMQNEGGYFPALKSNPEKYIHRCNQEVLDWLRQIKREKKTFLITGSHIDFASLTASTSLGNDWRSLFDVVVCYARKPGFFTCTRPFFSLVGTEEDKSIQGKDLQIGNVYSQGNWQDLYNLLRKETGKQKLKCVYFGDNLIQDIYTPSEYTVCDTVAVVKEMRSEDATEHNSNQQKLTSNSWDSYFGCPSNDSNQKYAHYSNWTGIIHKHAKLCIPTLNDIAQFPLNHSFPAFNKDDKNGNEHLGFYPVSPLLFS